MTPIDKKHTLFAFFMCSFRRSINWGLSSGPTDVRCVEIVTDKYSKAIVAPLPTPTQSTSCQILFANLIVKTKVRTSCQILVTNPTSKSSQFVVETVETPIHQSRSRGTSPDSFGVTQQYQIPMAIGHLLRWPFARSNFYKCPCKIIYEWKTIPQKKFRMVHSGMNMLS